MASAVTNKEDYKARIEENLDNTLAECFIPELGMPMKGKVREIYFTDANVVMVTNDRVSAFDYVLPNLIPFKGQVLNTISQWAMNSTKDIVPNAMVGDDLVDPAVVVQKKMKNVGVECIIRGYLWGSMAAAYEKGDRTFCGLKLEEGLIRFQKLPTPIFTPTTKAEVGHDENMTMEEVASYCGADVARQMKELSFKLYERGAQLMRDRGLILLDTKYEFGVDENGVLHVIDEVNTPDSSRMCDVKEWESKFPQIEKLMNDGNYRNVSDLLKDHPHLKPAEFSKQYVRDALLDMGFKPDRDKAVPKLSNEHVVECAYRYIAVCERVTGQPFEWPSKAVKMTPEERVCSNLRHHGFIKGCCVAVFAGSDSDKPHIDKCQAELAKYGIPSHYRICSAHKQPTRLEFALQMYNKSIEPMAIIASAGGTDALSGTASFLSVWPVVSCPPDPHNPSCIGNPPLSSNVYVQRPGNAARFIAQMFGSCCNVKSIRGALVDEAHGKVKKLIDADKWSA
ncbi:Phosphoribosylaminoimidazole-succinocarboxamide synthase, putative [Perkinsus marinus ATCC 50983]|uniref:SAICAR synthetase n=1 Tax=Perkinsus marinus (strain ATCC 50983 / TXsc) TaxID=423536 RepID=C5LB79_PERM5|nr:Phosphoribosylaminoimidazole-succinocarboxamide synthase, putative [Perkinsus marinus ATCC 50983]EER06007.1 Phosphoribosylaminoimidazole-succinocarboxamide synthase, putative [Perkinsus marinus ATCC 50983]|eukprot:XP_002774191.1 Phosphoribosylaminoimidazole-succinocarboxamide synthase, putative [Perkinsus marinus ATCC 50983]